MKFHLMPVMVFLLGVSFGTKAYSNEPTWSYSGATGPEHWAELDPAFALCRSGKLQSPINIDTAAPTEQSKLNLNYLSSPSTLLHNGHNLNISPYSKGWISVGPDIFDFKSVYFHTPSEVQINSQRFPLAVYLEHRSQAGKPMMVAILFEIGAKNSVLEKFLSSIPAQRGDVLTLGSFDATQLYPALRDYHDFIGSMTTQPCSEGMRLLVMTTPVQLSEAQLSTLQLAFPKSTRPDQPSNNRTLQVGG